MVVSDVLFAFTSLTTNHEWGVKPTYVSSFLDILDVLVVVVVVVEVLLSCESSLRKRLLRVPEDGFSSDDAASSAFLAARRLLLGVVLASSLGASSFFSSSFGAGVGSGSLTTRRVLEAGLGATAFGATFWEKTSVI